MKKVLLFFALFSLLAEFATASIDTISISSTSMKRPVKCVVILPTVYAAGNTAFPVVYLLHGAGGSYNNWVVKVPDMQELSDNNSSIIVCPDGASTSWYFDSPIDSAIRFETHIAIELPGYIDAHYRTIADRQHRAISGLSMGGHGALFIAFRHAGTFGACGSMSGALNVSMITKGYGVERVLGEFDANPTYYKDWSVLNIIENYPQDSLAIMIDCGAQDFIVLMSKAVHEKMIKLKIPHDYIERPGRHDWFYWKTAVRYQLLFFKEFFKKANLLKA